MIRVLVVEDQRTLADALEIAVDTQPDLDCVGAVGTVEDALALAGRQSPDVVLMDIRLPGMNGIEGTRRIMATHPRVRVLILTANTDPRLLTEAVAAGATAFLAKASTLPDILTAIRTPVEGKVLVEETSIAALAPVVLVPDLTGLTPREREILGLMGEGFAATVIAQRLVVSTHTARGHVKSVMRKLDAHTQLEAVIIATRIGLLPTPPTTS
ncbi:response regulator transcription factor [Kutzneria sp. 744]|uniref:response regulator n=1 Tax=Kutzneria sp. (strain 744) TaxID=345341 RepID=UPI0003EEDBCD|nr:response regulator transcription factor [Kutzneria sp. 744]EWM19150.1 LuxR-family two-component system transcriptional regulator [Kutzneria sp. 744]